MPISRKILHLAQKLYIVMNFHDAILVSMSRFMYTFLSGFDIYFTFLLEIFTDARRLKEPPPHLTSRSDSECITCRNSALLDVDLSPKCLPKCSRSLQSQ